MSRLRTLTLTTLLALFTLALAGPTNIKSATGPTLPPPPWAGIV